MKKNKLHKYTDSPAYRAWVKKRDHALEQLHHRAQFEATDEMRLALTNILQAAKVYYYELKQNASVHVIDSFDVQVKQTLRQAGSALYKIIQDMKVRSYILSKASETEIIARLNKSKQVINKVNHQDIHNIKSKDSFAGGKLDQRLQMYLDRLSRKVISMAQASAMNAPDLQSFLMDILQVFPKRKRVKIPRRILKPQLMEADKDPGFDVAVDMIDQNEWDDMVSAYKDEYIPKFRGPEFVIDIPTKEDETWYAWEFERDLTNEFVSAVRSGQIDSATENGITDFVWIAIVDSVTDECCLWRDGLLVSEIEKQMGQHDDDCDAVTPPAHASCRCSLAPATSEVPDKPDTGLSDFEDWLNS